MERVRDEAERGRDGLIYSTYLSGARSENPVLGIPVDTEGNAIALNGAGNAYVTGLTDTTDFPTTAGNLNPPGGGVCLDAFLTKVNALGSGLVYSTPLCGGHSGEGVALDNLLNPNAYVTGPAGGAGFLPTTSMSYQIADNAGGVLTNAFVEKIAEAALPPFGGEDTGFLPPPGSALLKCENGVTKGIGKLMAALAKCHIARASGKTTDDTGEDACEMAAIGKFTTNTKTDGCGSCTDLGAIAHTVDRVVDSNNALGYCE